MKPAFSDLNLRFNPFGELSQEERVLVACADVEQLAQTFQSAADNTAIQFLADHGRGKTTHLLSLHQHFQSVPLVRLHQHTATQTIRPWLAQHNPQMLFVDSIENLTWFKRLRVYRRFSKLAFTTHRDLSLEMTLMGLAVKTIVISQTDTQQLMNLFNRRVEYARRGEGSVPLVTEVQVVELQKKYGDDIRAMESALYTEYNLLNNSQM